MERDRLKFCIERFDHYFESVNNKSAVFLALGTFIVSGLVASYPFLKENVNCSFWLHLFFMLSIALGLTAMIIVITAATPYLSRQTTSMFYFNSIASKEEKSFSRESSKYSNEDELSDLRTQVHGLAHGLKMKFKWLRIAGIVYTVMFLALIPLIILIIKNLK
jgi:hypothetical protein